MTWLTSLSVLAEKATPISKSEYPDYADFIAACSPERIRALCELAKATRAWNATLSDYCDGPERDVVLAALAAVGALDD